MRVKRRMLVALLAAFAAAVVTAGSAFADDSAWKAAHDTDPHLPLTAQTLQMMAQKEQASADYLAGRIAPNGPSLGVFADWSTVTAPAPTGGALTPDMTCCGGGGGFPSAAYFAGNQTPQILNYYCGPAAVHEALGNIGLYMSQSTAASRLHTTTNGTAWSGGGTSPTGYPVPDVMNGAQGRNYYVPQYVSSPSSTAISNYESYLMTDIYGVVAPVVGDAWETSTSTYHLVGHPHDRTIFHWFDIRGYQNSGASTMYEDSVHDATSVSWYANVPAYSTLPSYEIVSIVAGRGYVW